MSIERYERYKASDVEWLGEVPEHWEVVRLKRLFEIRKRIAGTEGYDVLSVTQRGLKVKDTESNDGQLSMDYAKYQLVYPGDFAMNHMDLVTGYVDLSSQLGVTSPDYRVFTLRDQSAHARYFLYLLQNAYHQRLFYPFGQGSSQLGRWRLPAEQFNEFRFPQPPTNEQVVIAAFLDHETAKIDALVEEQKSLIEILREKRQAVITQAVTKGLNASAPMKATGVEWLVAIPEHWQFVPFSYAINYQEGPGIMASDFLDEGVPLLRLAGAQSRWATLNGCNYLDPAKVLLRWDHFRLARGDLVISGSASMETVCEVGEEAEGSIPYTGLIRLTAKPDIILKDYIRAIVSSWMFYVQIDQLKAGATIQHFGPTHLSMMKIALPQPDEQLAITAFLEKECSHIDLLIKEGEKASALLQERRSALISAGVTGKIDVRGIAVKQEAA